MPLTDAANLVNNEKSKKRRYSLGTLLAVTFGLLVAISVAAVLTLSTMANFKNTFSLLNTQAENLISNIERSLVNEADQAERAAVSVRSLFSNGNFALHDMQAQTPLIKSLLLALPNVEKISVFDFEGYRSGIVRKPDGTIETRQKVKVSDEAMLDDLNVSVFRESAKPVWGKPKLQNGRIFQSVTYSLVQDGEVVGVVAAEIGGKTLNNVVSRIAQENDAVVFVLDPQNNVLAHSRMPQIFKSRPVFPINEIPDNLLRALPDAEPADQFEETKKKGISVFETEGFDGIIYLTKEVAKDDQPGITVGAYLRKVDVGQSVQRMAISGFAGLAMLFLAVLIAAMLGRRLAKLLGGVSEAANKISKFDLAKIEELPGSRIREIDNQAAALNSANVALKAFSEYVPHTVVKRLVVLGEDATRSVERELTVMFVDIVGFTAITERMDAVSAANLLNSNYDIICEIIELHNGTVDKFMGDCVMAFWGAPDADNSHAQNALNAAMEISARMDALQFPDGENAPQAGKPLRFRIGLHTGRVIVGNIGGAGRHNYTIVGDTVNVAQRMEQMGKEFETDKSVIILASEKTVSRCVEDHPFVPLGIRQLRGREKPVTIFGHGIRSDAANVAGETIVAFPETKP